MENYTKTELLKFMTYVAKISDLYEKSNSDIKKEYLKKNVEVLNKIARKVPGNGGCFGTGYPYYALGNDFTGTLPEIGEQIRYNQQLIDEAKRSKRTIWSCRGCLEKNSSTMPDLKQICKPCFKMDAKLKPRKVINRLPDTDFWLICADGHIKDAEQILSDLFLKYELSSSDIDPIQTMYDVKQIANELEQGKMPEKLLPIDFHIIEYSKIKELISKVPEELEQSTRESDEPYLPIHPRSFRKEWQYDDEAYNFIHDFLLSFTEFDFNESLASELNRVRKQIVDTYTSEELYNILWSILGDSSKRRFQSTPELKKIFEQKMNLWRGIVVDKELPYSRED